MPDAPLSEAVLLTVADREERDAREFDQRLHSRIDPDALNSLFNGTTGRVTFEYMNYVVTVDCDGEVTLRE